MTGPAVASPDPLAQLLALKAQGTPDPLDALVALKNGNADPMAKWHADFKSGKLQRDVTNANEADAATIPDYPRLAAVAEAAQTPMAGLPGGALALSALRKTEGDTRPFAEIQGDVNRETSDVPYASALGRSVGGMASIGALPGATGLKAGAMLGGADQIANNDPHSGAVARIVRGVGGAAVGGALGGLTDAAITGTRALMAPGASEAVQAAQGARSEANASTIGPSYKTAEDQAGRYYGNLAQRQAAVKESLGRVTGKAPLALPAPGQSAVAQQEARQGFINHDFTNGPAPTLEQSAAHDFTSTTPDGEPFHDSGLLQQDFTKEVPIGQRAANDVNVRQTTSPVVPSSASVPRGPTGANAVSAMLDHPNVAPYANMIRNSEVGANMNDAEIGNEAYRMFSELQGKKMAITANGDFAPATNFQLRNIGALKDKLRTALAQVEPDFPEAVATHAEMSQPITAMKEGYNAARQTLGGPVPAKALGIPAKDPTAYLRQTVPTQTPEQANAAVLGVLSRTKGNIGLSPNPLTGFGVGKSAAAVNRIQPLVNALDQQGGNGLPSSLRNVLLALSQGQATP